MIGPTSLLGNVFCVEQFDSNMKECQFIVSFVTQCTLFLCDSSRFPLKLKNEKNKKLK